ncbi:MAG TPA: prepilin-type N-terminal cleavage/methylation domain-containing protein [Gemmatimonadaceae bacterium]|nr:prepilin-type N-terminal cleavage/methylation domain-containing protein [Gemmatimonadaceae bacterium]
MRPLTPGGAARPGFTLIELMVTMTMMVVVGAAVVSVFNSQQRFTRAAADVGDLRTQLQTATAVLPAELRNISATGNDIISMSDSSIAIRSTIVSSVVCSFVGTTQVTLAPSGAIPTTTPVGPSGTMRLTSVAMDPAGGDEAFIWDDGPQGMLSDDTWLSAANAPYAITGAVKTPGACAATYAPAGNTRDAYVLTIAGATPLRGTLTAGSAVRITRGAAYGLYQSDLDSKWYLGYRTLGAADYDYIAGPFLDYDPSAQSGFRFQYFDATGAEITNYAATATVARVEITARARTAAPVSLSGQPNHKLQEDSLRIGIALRNRN